MSRFCIVAPPRILNAIAGVDPTLLGSSHLLLAHHVAKHPRDYFKIFANDGICGPKVHNRLVIMDNSVIEMGSSVDLDMIREACSWTQPTCVVLPDIMLDGEATTRSCLAALESWTPKLAPIPFMFVPQGKTLVEFVKCAESISDHPDVMLWGVPRNLVATLGTRMEAIKLLYGINPHRAIHMLGLSDDMLDDFLCARRLEVTSIDSAVPLRITQPIHLSVIPPSRDPKWFDNAKYSGIILENLQTVRKWCSS